jgi:predicted RNase H-like HicB family nuclease
VSGRAAVRVKATFVKDGRWWVAWCDAFPGALTQGATLKEARENLLDALRMVQEPVNLSRLPKTRVRVEELDV